MYLLPRSCVTARGFICTFRMRRVYTGLVFHRFTFPVSAEFEKKLLKTEKRILKIIKRKSKVWSLTREDRRVFRKLLRESQQRTLLMKERNWLSKILTREKDKLTNKEKLKLKRYKKLIRMGRRRKPKKKQYV